MLLAKNSNISRYNTQQTRMHTAVRYAHDRPYVVVVFNYLLVTQSYTEDSCRPATIDSRQKQRSQISFHALSFQKI